MATETVTLALAKATWSLLSNVAAVPFDAVSRGGDAVLFFVGDTAPAATAPGLSRTQLAYTSAPGKVWARATKTPASVTVQRTVDAANAVDTVINAPAVTMNASFLTTATANAVVGTVAVSRVSGDSVDIFILDATGALVTNDARLVLSADKTQILRGTSAVRPGTIKGEVVVSHLLAANSPRRQAFSIDVAAPALTISGTPGTASILSDYSFVPDIGGGFGSKKVTFRSAPGGGLSNGWSVSDSGVLFGPRHAIRNLTGKAIGTLTVTDEVGNTASMEIGAIANPVPLLIGSASSPAAGGGVLPALLTLQAIGRQTLAGVKLTTIPLGAGATIVSGINTNHVTIDANGDVFSSAAGQAAGLQAADYVFTIGNSLVTTLTIPVETITGTTVADVSDLTTFLALANTADLSGNVLCRPRADIVATNAGTGIAIQNRVFNGTLTDVNKGKINESEIVRNHSVSISGGSLTVRPRVPLSMKFKGAQNATNGRGIVVYGSSNVILEDCFIENVAGADGWMRQIDGSDTNITAQNATSCILVRGDAGSPACGNVVLRRCVIGAPDDAPYTRYPMGVDSDFANQVVLEDCVIKNTLVGIRNQTTAFFTHRRCEIKNFLIDAVDGYPNNLPTSGFPTFPASECFYAASDFVIHSPNLGSEFAGAHCDGDQTMTFADDKPWRVSIHFGVWAMDADENVKQTQILLLKDGSPGIYVRGRVSNCIGVPSTLNGGIFSRMDPADRLVLANCTFVRSTKAVPVSAGPVRITVEKSAGDGVNVSGPKLVNCIFGAFLDTTGTPTDVFTADPVPGGSGSRTMRGGGTTLFDGNVYISQLTQDTGAGNSLKEAFSGFALSTYIAGRGYQFSIDYTSATTIKASAFALFTPKAGGPAVGKGASLTPVAANQNFMFAATRLRFPSVTGTFPAAGNYQIQNFFFGSPAYDVTEPRFFLPTFYQLTTGATTSEVAAPNAINFEGLSIKVGGVWYACPTAAFVMDPATESSGYLLDAIPGVTIPANSFIEGRIAFNGATGAVAIGATRVSLLGEMAGGSTTSLAAKLTDGSTITQSNAVARQLCPSYMVAKGGDGRPVFLLAGDSIQAGANENGASNGLLSPRGNVGYWQRALDDNTGSKRIAYGTLALEGARPGDWSTRANWAKKLDAVKKVTTLNGGVPPMTHVGSNHGNNSINSADLYATNVAFWQVCKTEWPGIPIHHSELLARPGSTDGFQTLANQTAATVDAYPNGQRWVFNEKVGKGALTGDPTAQARVDGWIAGSFASWRVASYDLTTNRDKLSIIPGVLTLTAAVAQNATVLPLSDASGLQAGDMLGINYVAASTASFDTTILSISGNNVTVSSGATQAFSAGTPVNPMWNDRAGLHPGTRHHMRIAAEAGIPWKVANGWGL